MESTSIKTDRTEALLDQATVDLKNVGTDSVICRGATQHLLVRVANRVSEPIHLHLYRQFRADCGSPVLSFESERSEYRAVLSVQPAERGLQFDVTVEGPEPIWMVEWTLDGFDLNEVIIPALGGQVITEDMPPGESITFKYPFWWNAQFAIGMGKSFDGGVCLWTTDTEPIFKLLRVGRSDDERFSLTLGIETKAPLQTGELSGTWFLETFEGSWTHPVDTHRDWMTHTFGLVPYQEHRHWPDWAGDIQLVFEVWGMRKDTGRPAHTFEQTEERLEKLSGLFPPEHTLLYLPGFAQGGIDSNIPNYDPSEKLGGRAGFAHLVNRAHHLGYRVMIHTNVLGMAYCHPLYDEFARYQVVDVFDRPQGWAMDLDGDWLTEPYFAYMNPGEPAWSDLMTSILGELIREFDLDGVFLDQTLLAFNVSRGPNFVSGMRRHVQALQEAFPKVLFAGEGLNDIVQPSLPFAQIHGLDSITGVHGMDSTQSWRRVHPVSVRLFGESTRFAAHLLTKHPTHPFFDRQEQAYADLNVLPAIVCYDASQTLDDPAVYEVLERARSIQ